MIIPRPQSETYYGGTVEISDVLTISSQDEEIQNKAIELINIYVPSLEVEKCEEGLLSLVYDKTLNCEEYRLDIDDKILIKYSDFYGVKNALATLVQLMTKEKDSYTLIKCHIEDKPKFKVRSFMLDLGRGVGRKEEIKETLIRMSLMKYNRVHLHLIDSEGVSWQSQAYPLLTGPRGDQYSMQYFKSLDKLCQSLGLEVLPELEVPAHNGTILRCYPEFACEVDEKEHPSKWVLCAGNEKIFDFYRALIKEMIEMFPSCKSIHIGGDEVDFGDMPMQRCNWDFCPKCQALGYGSMQEIHYYVIKKVYDIVKELGKNVVMWNDWVDISKPCPLPKDIEMHFWRVADKVRGPYEGCSMEKFLEQGYKVVNSSYPDAYFSNKNYASSKSLSDWLPTKRPETDEKYHDLILGGEGCAWEYGNEERYRFYRFTLPSPMGLMADRLWNGTYHEYDKEYESALTKAILGVRCKPDFNIFELLGTIMLDAKTTELGVLENIKATVEELKEAIMSMIPTMVTDEYGRFAALYYAECLNWVIDHK